MERRKNGNMKYNKKAKKKEENKNQCIIVYTYIYI